jgi:hypothetical protein
MDIFTALAEPTRRTIIDMNNNAEDTMRKVVLYMTMTCDGFFSGPHGELDWMAQTPDQELNDEMVACNLYRLL